MGDVVFYILYAASRLESESSSDLYDNKAEREVRE